jgi:hypothetical protein
VFLLRPMSFSLAIDSKMNDIEIIEYDNEMKEPVRTFFRSIYPDEPFMAEKMSYDATLPNHVTTKIALQGDSVIGQANIFKKAELTGNRK